MTACYLWIWEAEVCAEGCGSVTASPEEDPVLLHTTLPQTEQITQTTTTPSPKTSSRYLTTRLQHLRAASVLLLWDDGGK